MIIVKEAAGRLEEVQDENDDLKANVDLDRFVVSTLESLATLIFNIKMYVKWCQRSRQESRLNSN